MKIMFYMNEDEHHVTPIATAHALIESNAFKADELRELSEYLRIFSSHNSSFDPITDRFNTIETVEGK